MTGVELPTEGATTTPYGGLPGGAAQDQDSRTDRHGPRSSRLSRQAGRTRSAAEGRMVVVGTMA